MQNTSTFHHVLPSIHDSELFPDPRRFSVTPKNYGLESKHAKTILGAILRIC